MRRMDEFGESLLWLLETWEGGRTERLEPKFEKRVWLGVCPRTDEAIIGTPAGVARAEAVKRQANEDACKASSLLSISTSPWTTERQRKRHYLTVENDEEEKMWMLMSRSCQEIQGGFALRMKTLKESVFRMVVLAAMR